MVFSLVHDMGLVSALRTSNQHVKNIMKKWFILATIVCVAGFAQAGKKDKGDQTKEQYITAEKAKAEKKGKDFDKSKAEKKFDKKDTNKDGIINDKDGK